jgi:hypothetical protein
MATTAMVRTMIAETSFIEKVPSNRDLNMLKHEAIDRLDSVVDDLPKYKKELKNLIENFTVEDMLSLMNVIYRDTDFKSSAYYKRYNGYFDEIEDLIFKPC